MNKLESIKREIVSTSEDAFIITDETNVRYALGMEISDAYLLVTHNDIYLLTDFRYKEAADTAVGELCEVLMPKDKIAFIAEALHKVGARKLFFEGSITTYAFYKKLKDALPGIELADCGKAMDTLRAVKSEDEISSIKVAQNIADAAFKELLGRLTTDMTEIEVAAELEYLMRRMGSEGTAFQTIAVSGDASALPHGVPRNVKLKAGFLTLDFGAKFNGYCSDMTRTLAIGRADNEMKKLYNTVLNAQLSAIEYLSSGGRDAGAADRVAREIIDVEYPGAFGHSLGHGVGLLVHEAPRLSPSAGGDILVPGNVVTVEPGIYLYGKYGCRIEDMVAIGNDGVFNFTNSPKELIEIT